MTQKKSKLKGKSSSKSAFFKLHVGFFRAVSGSTVVEVQKSGYITTVPSQRMFLSGPSLPTLSRKATGFEGLGIESDLPQLRIDPFFLTLDWGRSTLNQH